MVVGERGDDYMRDLASPPAALPWGRGCSSTLARSNRSLAGMYGCLVARGPFSSPTATSDFATPSLSTYHGVFWGGRGAILHMCPLFHSSFFGLPPARERWEKGRSGWIDRSPWDRGASTRWTPTRWLGTGLATSSPARTIQ